MNGRELRQVGFECNDIHFDFKDRAYRASLSCQVYLYNPSSLTLDPYSSGAFTFTIPINGELQERIPVDLSDINPGTPIAIKAYLTQLENPVMFVIQMNPRDFGNNIYPSSSKGAISVTVGVGKAVLDAVKENPKSMMIVSSIGESTYTAGISWIIQTWAELYWKGLTEPIPSDNSGDNNLIIGDES